MHLAVEEVYEGVLLVLAPLIAASSIDPEDKEVYAPLRYAACWGHIESWLHSAKGRGGGSSAGAASSTSFTSILKIQPALTADNEEITEERLYDPILCILLDNGARVEATDPFRQTSMHLAVFAQQLPAISLLLKHGKCELSPRNSANFSPPMWAADNNLKETAELLLKLDADPMVATSKGQTPLLFAAHEQNIEMIQLFLQFNADPCATSEEGGSPPYISCPHRSFEAAELLIEKATDLNVRFKESGDSPLLITSDWIEQHKNAEALIVAGADITLSNNDHCTPLHIAAFKGGKSSTKLLIPKGADLTGRTIREGVTPLACAVSSESHPFVQLLANVGSDLRVPCFGGSTLLHLAAFLGLPETVRLFLDADLDPNAVDD